MSMKTVPQCMEHIGTCPENYLKENPSMHNIHKGILVPWSGQRDSNPRMMAWEAIALPLGDARIGVHDTTSYYSSQINIKISHDFY